jgi:hypothetical protein
MSPFWEWKEKEDVLDDLWESIQKQEKAGLTGPKAWAFIEEKLGVRGRPGKISRAKLPLWMAKALKEEAKKEKIPQAELIRRALTIYLELKPEEREQLTQALRGKWWEIDYLIEHLDEVEEAYKRELLREQKRKKGKNP